MRAGVRTLYRARSPPMFYTYVLKCGAGNFYVGSAIDLKKRITEHQAGKVPATAHRLPIVLEYYEAVSR